MSKIDVLHFSDEEQDEKKEQTLQSPEAQIQKDSEQNQTEESKKGSKGCMTLLGFFFLAVLYFATFAANLLAAYIFYQTGLNKFAYIVLGAMFASYFFKILIVIFLEEEWDENIPYIPPNEMGKKSFRNILIIIAVLLNIDYIYWIYIVYFKWRDGVVEQMTNMIRVISFFFEFVPIFMLCLYYEMNYQNPSPLVNLAIGLCLLSSVNAMHLINFFNIDYDQELKDTFCWLALRICEMWARGFFLIAAYITLENFELSNYLVGSIIFIGIVQFAHFNDFDDTFSGTLESMVFYIYKSGLLFVFREKSYGFPNLDSESHPNIFLRKKDLNINLYSQISYGILLFGTLQLMAICAYFGDPRSFIESNLQLLIYTLTALFGFAVSLGYGLFIFIRAIKSQETEEENAS